MGKSARGKRDGSGPFQGSLQRKLSGRVGRRRLSGQPCPKSKKR